MHRQDRVGSQLYPRVTPTSPIECTTSIRGVLVERFTGRRRLVGEECIEKLLATAVLLLADGEGNRILTTSAKARIDDQSRESCAMRMVLNGERKETTYD